MTFRSRKAVKPREAVCLLFSECSALPFLMCFRGIAGEKIYILPVDVIRFLYNHLKKKNKSIRQSWIELFSPLKTEFSG